MSTAQRIGDFAVCATSEEVRAFCAATGCVVQAERLPLTFPIRWFMSPAIRDALMALLPEPDLIPVHEGQGFDYVEPLEVGVPYQMAVDAHRESEPARLVVRGTVCSLDGEICARLDATLRLFGPEAA